MSTDTFRTQRARYASLTRSRPSNDPELVATRQRMTEQAFIDAINRALVKAPPLTPELRERVLGLLSSSTTGGAA